MAQPPLSVSIQKLEADIGLRLFERGGAGGVSLTASGKAALADARKLLFHNSQMLIAARAAKEGTGGALVIGFVGSTMQGLLQKSLRIFRAEYPNVELVLKESISTRIVENVESGEFDIGLIRTPLLISTQLRVVPLITEPFMAALPAGNSLSQKAELLMSDLASEPFVFYSREQAAGLQAMAMLACHRAGFSPKINQEATQIQTVLSLVESGLGVALVPSTMRNYIIDRVVYRAIADISDAAEIGLSLALPEMANPVAQKFCEVARSVFL